jgi:hypothetical protein
LYWFLIFGLNLFGGGITFICAESAMTEMPTLMRGSGRTPKKIVILVSPGY